MKQTKILFAGDFCVRGKTLDLLYDEKIKEISAPIKEVTSLYDISVVNIETVFCDIESPVKKSGPNLRSPLKALDLLKEFGFSTGALANNHVCDQGDETGLSSMECIKNIGISTMGYGKNLSEAKKALKIEKNGISISFLNFAENEFYPAGISSPGFSPIDYFENPRQVRREKENSDFVFVFLHAGNEHCPFPRDGIKKFCHTLVDSGADGVIISHPHCPQGFEYYNAKPIAYSTGNFFMSNFSDKISRWNIGYMADITIKEDKSIILSPVPYEFTPSCDSFRFLTGSKKDSFIKYLNSLSKIITETPQEEYQNLLYAWSIMYMRTMADFIENAKADALFNGEYMLFIKNAFSCESHSEVMKNYFTALTQNRLESFEKYIKKIETLQEMPF